MLFFFFISSKKIEPENQSEMAGHEPEVSVELLKACKEDNEWQNKSCVKT